MAQVGFSPAQQRGKAEDRAALALPSAPDAVRLGKGARAREEGKPAAVLFIEAADLRLCRAENRFVRALGFRPALLQVREQTEGEVLARVAAAEAKFLEPRGKALRLLRRGEERRDDAERAPCLRHAVLQRHARDAARLGKTPKRRVQQLFDEFRDRQKQQHGAEHAVRERTEQNGECRREEQKGRDIKMPGRPLRLRRHQREADVALVSGGAVRLRQERLGVVTLGDAESSRLPCEHFAILRARGAVHLRIDAGRVAAEQAVERVRPLEQLAEIERGERAQGRKMRADGLVRRIVRRKE